MDKYYYVIVNEEDILELENIVSFITESFDSEPVGGVFEAKLDGDNRFCQAVLIKKTYSDNDIRTRILAAREEIEDLDGIFLEGFCFEYGSEDYKKLERIFGFDAMVWIPGAVKSTDGKRWMALSGKFSAYFYPMFRDLFGK